MTSPNITTSTETFTAILSDMDGTLFDSTQAIVHHWTSIANELKLDPQTILATSHGRRSIDVLRIIAPERANMEYVHHIEGLIPKHYAADAKILPGTRDLVTKLTDNNVPWAIVTSGTTVLASSWIEVMGLPPPKHFVTADDVKNGKPDPECYKLGLEKVFGGKEMRDTSKVLVLEDAPAGIKAGKAAGCTVLALTTTHTRREAIEAGADWIVDDLGSVEFVKGSKDGIELKIKGERIKHVS